MSTTLDLVNTSKLKFIPSWVLRILPGSFNFNSPIANRVSWRLFYEWAIRGKPSELVAVTPKGKNSPLYLRRGSTDITNFVSIFLHKDYSYIPEDCRVIFDLGGYIGLSSAFFAIRCPNAKIIVLEPDIDNYALCVLNNRPNSNVKVLRGAVWGSNCKLEENSRLYGEMSVSFLPSSHPVDNQNVKCLVDAYTIEDLLSNFDVSSIDFLKMDIEGGEVSVFSAPGADEWLAKTSLLSIELHESKFPGCEKAVRAAMLRNGFSENAYGEYSVFRRL